MKDPIVVETDWLREHLDESQLAIIDVRPPQFYVQAHIPGAVNLPVFFLGGADILPPANNLAARLGSLGVTREHHIVAYDEGDGPSAAFVWRILSYYGHRPVSVLNGGITKWRREGNDVEYGANPVKAAEYVMGEPDVSSLARLDDVRQGIESPNTAIVDVRSPAEYLGLQMTTAQSGHVPGAVNVEWSNNLTTTPEEIQVLRPDAELEELYSDAGVTPDKKVIVYCASGNRASETYMVLKKLGYPSVGVYLPGWQEWGNNPDLPVEE